MSKPKLLADENIPRTAIVTLRNEGYDVLSVWEIMPGMSDEDVVKLAISESRIIVTFDKDFGRIALLNPEVPGVVLLRIPPSDPTYIVNRLLSALTIVKDLYGKLIIIRKRTVKIIPLQ